MAHRYYELLLLLVGFSKFFVTTCGMASGLRTYYSKRHNITAPNSLSVVPLRGQLWKLFRLVSAVLSGLRKDVFRRNQDKLHNDDLVMTW